MISVTSAQGLWNTLHSCSERTKAALNPLTWIHQGCSDEAQMEYEEGSDEEDDEADDERRSPGDASGAGSPPPPSPGPEREPEGAGHSSYGLRERLGLFLGPISFILILLFLPANETFTPLMRSAAACTAWVAIWWVTEALPIPATSLLPLILFPLTGVVSFEETVVGYADPNVFLFLGGFTLAVCMQRWNLHRRLALTIISKVGTNPPTLILGFMASTAFLSMWISNTATAMMMLPIAMAVIGQVAELVNQEDMGVDTSFGRFSFGTALMLGIAYSATIGGVGTLIGTPPNAIFASVVGSMFDTDISFAQWLLYGFPIAVVFTLLAWAYLIRAFPIKELGHIRGGEEVVERQLASLGPITRPERMVGAVFVSVAALWIFRSLLLEDLIPGLSDPLIAVLGAVLLFLIPVNFARGEFLLDWDSAVEIPWGILLLFGAGIAIATGFTETGLSEWVGNQLAALAGVHMVVIMLAVVALVVLLSNVTSNTGTVSMMLPVMVAMAVTMQVHPYALMITCATAGSFAFLLPVGTPPNAVVFGSRYITIPQMAKAGLLLTLLTIVLLPLVTYFWLPVAWGIDLTTFPPGW